jgi:hypothetical protein
MKKYIGVKEIIAKPMTLGEYNEYRGWTIPDREDTNANGFLVEYVQSEESPNVNHPDHKGCISWSPADVFEDAYSEESIAVKSFTDPIPDHQARVVDEYDNLRLKVSSLIGFFTLPLYRTIPIQEQKRMLNQSLIMRAYLSVLADRINNF